MSNDDLKRARAILDAIPKARAELRGSGPSAKRAGAATAYFSAYRRDGVLAPHVRDVYNARGVQAVRSALDLLEELARAVLEPEESEKPTKLRADVNEIAHRVMLEATGQAPKTVPPSERTDEEKNPEAVKRGKKGGEKGGEARAEALTDEEREEIAQTAALARWKKSVQD